MARAGWEVTVHEAEETIGGGVRSAELTLPGFVHDVCSAIHPLGRDSPFFRDLELPVDWVQPPAEAAHPLDDGTAVITERSYLETAARLGEDRRRLHAPLPPGRRRVVTARAVDPRPASTPAASVPLGPVDRSERALERPLAREPVPTREARALFARPRCALDPPAGQTPEWRSRPLPRRDRSRLRLGLPPWRVATDRRHARRPAPRARRGDPHGQPGRRAPESRRGARRRRAA